MASAYQLPQLPRQEPLTHPWMQLNDVPTKRPSVQQRPRAQTSSQLTSSNSLHRSNAISGPHTPTTRNWGLGRFSSTLRLSKPPASIVARRRSSTTASSNHSGSPLGQTPTRNLRAAPQPPHRMNTIHEGTQTVTQNASPDPTPRRNGSEFPRPALPNQGHQSSNSNRPKLTLTCFAPASAQPNRRSKFIEDTHDW